MKEDNINEVFDGAFRIIGDKLDPNEISSLLGIKPDHSHMKGQPNNKRSKTGKVIVGMPYKTGIWSINSQLMETSSLEEHLVSLISRLEPVKGKIKLLSSSGYRVDFYCGYFFSHGIHGGFDISHKTLMRIGQMGISLAISTNEMD